MANTMLTGNYRIRFTNANLMPLAVVAEENSSTFGGAVGSPNTDPTVMPTFNQAVSPIYAHDDRIEITFRPDSTVTEVTGGAGTYTLRLPVTWKDTRTGLKYKKMMTFTDFTLDRTNATQAWTAGQEYLVMHYTIPQQTELKLGQPIIDVRVDSKWYVQSDVKTS